MNRVVFDGDKSACYAVCDCPASLIAVFSVLGRLRGAGHFWSHGSFVFMPELWSVIFVSCL
ncbi:MAG TPA: hypothetical protein VGB45_08005 [Abditibacterium sp.]